MQPINNPRLKRLRGWILDVYPSVPSTMNVWIITEDGKRVHLMDELKHRIYVSDKQNQIHSLFYELTSNSSVDSFKFVTKYTSAAASQKTEVLEIRLKDYKKTSSSNMPECSGD